MAWRATIRSAAKTTLTSWIATLSDGLALFDARPASFKGQCIYIDRIEQTITATGSDSSGVKMTGAEMDLVLVAVPGPSREEAATLDTLADSLETWLTDNPKFISANTVAEPTHIISGELDMGEGIIYPTVTVTVGRIIIREGY